MPAKGWECPECKMPMMVEDTKGNHLTCMNCGAVALQPIRRRRTRGTGEAYARTNQAYDDYKQSQLDNRPNEIKALEDVGVNVVDKPKRLTEYNPEHMFNPLAMALNELGFESVQELLQEYVKLKAVTKNQDLRDLGLSDEADELDQQWIEYISNAHNQFGSPFMSAKRGRRWDDPV